MDWRLNLRRETILLYAQPCLISHALRTRFLQEKFPDDKGGFSQLHWWSMGNFCSPYSVIKL